MEQKGTIYRLQKKTLPDWGASKCVFSDLTLFEKEDSASPLSVKMVLGGIEEYQVNGRGFKLEENQFLVVNKGDALETKVKNQKGAQGICIYPPEKLLAEVYMQNNLSLSERLELKKNETEPIRFTSKPLRIESNKLTANLFADQVQCLLSNEEKSDDWWEVFYMELAERLIRDQLDLENRLNKLPSTGIRTKEELYRRLSLAKDYIHDYRYEPINIESLSKTCALSKYHFLRSFKALYGCSPYQLSLQLKLNEARHLIQKKHSYQQAADLVGYSDAKNLRKALLKTAQKASLKDL